jgi:hypothetical protein
MIQLGKNSSSPVTTSPLFIDSRSRSGWASTKSQWSGSNWGSPYAIVVADLKNFINSLDPNYGMNRTPTPPPTKSSSSHSRNHKFFHPSSRRSLKQSTRRENIEKLNSPSPRNLRRVHNPNSSQIHPCVSHSSSLHDSSHLSVKQVPLTLTVASFLTLTHLGIILKALSEEPHSFSSTQETLPSSSKTLNVHGFRLGLASWVFWWKWTNFRSRAWARGFRRLLVHRWSI